MSHNNSYTYQKPCLTALSLMLLALCAGGLLAACGGNDAEEEAKKKAAGERISVLSFERRLEIDPRMREVEVRLPPPYVNDNWAQPGGMSSNALHHLALNGEVKKLFSVSFVAGSGRNAKITATPIIAAGRVYALGADMKIVAVDADTGRRLWRKNIAPKDSEIEDGFGGGIAYWNGRIFAATGFGEILALDAESGALIWRVKSVIPFRAAPTVDKGRIFVISHDNQLQVYAAEDGARLWNQMAIIEPASILSSTSPAVSDDLVVAGFSSGEVLALRANNGTLNWADSLTRSDQLTPLSDLNPVIGRPVIDRDRVFAVSHGGRMVSIDLRSGERVWMSEFTSIETPWVAGDYIFFVTIDAQVICVSRNQGRVRWIRQLQRFEDDDDQDDRVTWAGPVLAGDKLILASSQEQLVFLSPYTGEIINQLDIGDTVHVAPIVANKTLYILTDKGRLTAYR